MRYVIAVRKKRLNFRRVVRGFAGIKNLNNMVLQKKSYVELQDLFKTAFKNWEKSVNRMEEVRKIECVKYSDFVANRAELRRLMAENAKFHSLIVQIDLEMQIRVWTGKND